MYEITVSRTFDAGHAMALYDGSVEPSHRHDWKVQTTVGARELDRIGVVMDFHRLAEQVERVLADVQGRSFNDIPPFASEPGSKGINPTAEQIARWFGSRIADGLPPDVHLISVTIDEAPGCAATYRP